jgi:hypothetical protein
MAQVASGRLLLRRLFRLQTPVEHPTQDAEPAATLIADGRLYCRLCDIRPRLEVDNIGPDGRMK